MDFSLKNVTIKKLLVSGAIIISLILIFIGLFTNQFVKKSLKESRIITNLKDIQNLELTIRKAEKEFLAAETNNPDFHSSRQSIYLEDIYFNLEKSHQILQDLMLTSTIIDLGKVDELNHVNDLFKQYRLHMEKMKDQLLLKGFKDYGTIGKMRERIHSVEEELQSHDNAEYRVNMLTLRRHEKDYLLRKDLKYQEKFKAALNKFINEIISSGNEADQKLIVLLEDYNKLFNQVIQHDVAIGLNSDKGILKNINTTVDEIEENLNFLSSTIQTESTKKINKAIFNLFLLIAIFSLIIVYVIFRTSKHVVDSIHNLSKYITLLGKGELPDDIPIFNNDEIAHMKQSVNELTKNLKNTKDFAIAVGNGQFETEVNVFNNEGELGTALVEMREKLLQVSKERELQIQESDERIWANEGFNQIHDVLSGNQNLGNDFYYTIISKLTKYLKANQGTMLIVEDKNGEDVLVTKGTFAFDRNRIHNKEIQIGEGIIGSVAYEKQTTYMSDLPNNYINITSGLGDATPNYLLIVPCMIEDELFGVIEIASFKPIEKFQIEFVEKVAIDIANNLKKLTVEQTTRELLEQTQSQASELTSKEEEMRQNFEELKATQEAMETRENELLKEIQDLKNENEIIKRKSVLV